MGYRETMTIRARSDANHPFNHGIKMQAHHLVSKYGVSVSGLQGELNHLGYDIDEWTNLVLLPCTLKGACHLKVQLHRGNHTAQFYSRTLGVVADDDDDKPISYHSAVALYLLKAKKQIEQGKHCDRPKEFVQALLNNISEKLFNRIKKFVIPLTSISENFIPLVRAGCCGEDTIPQAQARLDAAERDGPRPVCPENRNHLGQEGISWRNGGDAWTLRIGK